MTLTSRILVGLVAWGALSFGAVYPWGYWPLAIASAAIGLRLIVVTRAWREPRPRAMAAMFAVVACAVALQLVPLPYEWFKRITPHADAVLSQLQLGWAVRPPAFHPVSIAAAGTWTSLGLFLALALLIIGLSRGVAYMPLEWIVTQLTVFGLAMALLGIVQRVIYGPGDILVYGFWRASGYAQPFGPFINRNHFAGWMVLVLPVALAAATSQAHGARAPFQPTRRGWRSWLDTADASRFFFLTIAILVMLVALVLTGSRSGLIGIFVAMMTLGLLGLRRRERHGKRIPPALYLLALAIVAIGWVGVDRTVSRFQTAREELSERTAAWRDTIAIARDFPLTGVGLGGYGRAMLVYQTADRHSFYEQAHNDYLQVLAEGGALVTLPAALALAVIVSNIRHRLRGSDPPTVFWIRAGAVAGLVGIAAQSLLDFSLQMPGNAMMCAVLIAIALHRPSSTPHAHRV